MLHNTCGNPRIGHFCPLSPNKLISAQQLKHITPRLESSPYYRLNDLDRRLPKMADRVAHSPLSFLPQIPWEAAGASWKARHHINDVAEGRLAGWADAQTPRARFLLLPPNGSHAQDLDHDCGANANLISHFHLQFCVLWRLQCPQRHQTRHRQIRPEKEIMALQREALNRCCRVAGWGLYSPGTTTRPC